MPTGERAFDLSFSLYFWRRKLIITKFSSTFVWNPKRGNFFVSISFELYIEYTIEVLFFDNGKKASGPILVNI